jgi:hypothetical protein
MTFRPSLFILPTRCLSAASSAPVHHTSASEFSDRTHANFQAFSFSSGALNFSNIQTSISHQSDNAARDTLRETMFDMKRDTKRNACAARSSRNGYSLPPVNLSQTSAAMSAPYFIEISYPLRRNCGA